MSKCRFCDEGYHRFVLPNGEGRHESLGISWSCGNDIDKSYEKREELRNEIANSGDC